MTNIRKIIEEKNVSEDEIIKKFERPIEKALFQTNPQEREDLKQVLLMKVLQKSKEISFKEDAPEFWSFFKTK